MQINRAICYLLICCGLFLAITKPAGSTEDWFNQGVAHIKANRLDKAVEAFTRAIEMIPHDYEAYNNRGIAYSRKTETSLAEIDFSKALELNPKFYDAYLNRGIARQKQGGYAFALLDYTEAHQLRPKNQRPQLLIAWILAISPNNRLRNGALALEIAQTLAHNRSDTTLFPLLAAAHAATGDFETAITFQKKSLSTLYAKQADSHQVEQQQHHLARFQSGRPLQDATPSSQNLSDSDANYIMARVTRALKRSILATSPPITLATTKQTPTGKIPRKETPPESAKTLPIKSPPPSEIKSRGAIQLSNLKRASQPAPTNFPYVLVIGSFKSSEKGFPAAKKLHQKGHPVFTSWVAGQAGKKWYQLYYGWYPDKISADAAAASLKEKRFHSVLVRHAPFTLQIQLGTNHAAQQSVKKRLEQINLIGYQIGRRLMIGAYNENRINEIIMTEALTAAGLSYQLIER